VLKCYLAGWLIKLHKSLAREIVEVRTAGPKMPVYVAGYRHGWVIRVQLDFRESISCCLSVTKDEVYSRMLWKIN